MRAAIAVERTHFSTQIDPEFRVAFSETHVIRRRAQLAVIERFQHCLIEAGRAIEVTHANGDMVDHVLGIRSGASYVRVRHEDQTDTGASDRINL